MIDAETINALRERHPEVHPLLFQRSVEHAETAGELFDILESLPPLPVSWNEKKRRWVRIKDVIVSERVDLIRREPND